jgi:hypothetical protein
LDISIIFTINWLWVHPMKIISKRLYQIRVITVFTVFRLLTDFVCLYTYEFWLSLFKIVRSSVILLLPLFAIIVEKYCHLPGTLFLLFLLIMWGYFIGLQWPKLELLIDRTSLIYLDVRINALSSVILLSFIRFSI